MQLPMGLKTVILSLPLLAAAIQTMVHDDLPKGLVWGLDTPNPISRSDFATLRGNGKKTRGGIIKIQHAALRVYTEGWGKNPAGRIDDNFLKNYANAFSTGYSIDAIWSPCNGKLHGHKCKSYAQQVKEILHAIKGKAIGVVWIEIDLDDDGTKNWGAKNYTNNLIWANEMINSYVNSKYSDDSIPPYGILTNPGRWELIFGRPDAKFDYTDQTHIPLWYKRWDHEGKSASDLSLPQKFGMWKEADAKQYRYLGDYNVNIFRNGW